MRVICHCSTDYIRNLDKTFVIEFFHCVKQTALNRFQTIIGMRNGAVKNGIRRIVEIPALEHAAQLMSHSVVSKIYKHRAKAAFSGFGAFFRFFFRNVFVAHFQ